MCERCTPGRVEDDHSLHSLIAHRMLVHKGAHLVSHWTEWHVGVL